MASFTVVETADRKGTDKNKVRTYNRTFVVITDDPVVGSKQVLEAPNIPQIGEAYIHGSDIDMNAQCEEISATQIDGTRLYWKVEATFTTDKKGETTDDPLDQPPDITVSGQKFSKIYEKGWRGVGQSTDSYSTQVPIVNSCGERFDHGVDGDDTRIVVTYQRNYRWFDLRRAWLYRDAVNIDSFLLLGVEVPPSFAKIGGFGGRRLTDKALKPYWQVSVEIHVDESGWRRVLLDAGLNQISLTTGKLISQQTDDGQPISVERPLDGFGIPLSQSAISANQFVYYTFKLYRELPFAPLMLS